jgi:hypothetical protein
LEFPNCLAIIIINYTPAIKPFSGAVAREEKRRLLQGEFRTHILYFVLNFALLNFYLHCFIKNTKKLVPFIVVIFVGLLLSCFIMLSINGWFC